MIFFNRFKRHRTIQAVKLEKSSISHSDAISSLGEHFGHIGNSFQDFIEIIEKIALTTPDVSQAISRTILLGNTGHSVSLEGLPETQREKAQQEINKMAKEVFRPSAGLDSLVNQLIRQICITGALSAEWVPSVSLEGVERVVIVPTRQIKFKIQDEEYIPVQHVNLKRS